MTETVEGLDKLIKDISNLERLPQGQITKGVRKSVNIVLKEAKRKAPKRTGTLRRGLVIKPEKSKKGKKVYRVIPKETVTEFVKITKNGDRYYYPASQEYGFTTVNGGRVEGKYYMADALTEKHNEVIETMVAIIGDEIEKALAEGKLR